MTFTTKPHHPPIAVTAVSIPTRNGIAKKNQGKKLVSSLILYFLSYSTSNPLAFTDRFSFEMYAEPDPFLSTWLLLSWSKPPPAFRTSLVSPQFLPSRQRVPSEMCSHTLLPFYTFQWLPISSRQILKVPTEAYFQLSPQPLGPPCQSSAVRWYFAHLRLLPALLLHRFLTGFPSLFFLLVSALRCCLGGPSQYQKSISDQLSLSPNPLSALFFFISFVYLIASPLDCKFSEGKSAVHGWVPSTKNSPWNTVMLTKY